MDGQITGETAELIGLSIIDNNDIEHIFDVKKESGEITGHEQDGYPDDPYERTPIGNEYVNQARKFAKWHVYRERGYDTVPSTENPDRIVAAMLALSQLSEGTTTELFGDLRTQLQTHVTGGAVDLPFEDADPGQIVVYRKDIYVQPDPTTIEPPVVEQFCEYVSNPIETFEGIFGDGVVPEAKLPEFDIEAVSDLHYLHSDGMDEQTHWSKSPVEREPDARLELTPVDPDVFDSYRLFLLSHLGNQVRDCYLLMGCEPPEVFQSKGLGSYKGMLKQQLYDIYDTHYAANAVNDPWADNTKHP